MSGWAKAASLPLMGTFFLVLGCSVPSLKSSPERGPTVVDIVNHINCELARIVNRRNERINQWIDASRSSNPPVDLKLDYLTTYHFVASVLVTLDALDSEALTPSVNFITPFNMMGSFNRTWSVGGNLSGSQERNIQFGYSIDLAELSDLDENKQLKPVSSIDKYCRGPLGVAGKDSGALTGDLGLTDIVVDGLLGLDASKDVNLYGNSGPNPLTMSLDIPSSDTKNGTKAEKLKKIKLEEDALSDARRLLHLPNEKILSKKDDEKMLKLIAEHKFPEAKALLVPALTTKYGPEGEVLVLMREGSLLELQFGDKNSGFEGLLYFAGNISFNLSTVDQKAPGTVALTGKAVTKDGTNGYFLSLTGSTIQQNQNGDISFTLSGTMSKLEKLKGDPWSTLGFGPKLNLSGSIDSLYETKSLKLTGTVSPDPSGPEIPVTASVPAKPLLTAKASPVAGNGGPSASGSSGSAKGSTAGAAGSSSLFGSLVSFIISYGANGGPNWTVATLKGPSAGSSGSLASLSRQDTDTLTITFVPACKTDPNRQPTPTDFWDSLPHCDAWAKASAAQSALANNALILAGRGQ
jgi:hypothetical protein